mgnify:CR=1 FL=1
MVLVKKLFLKSQCQKSWLVLISTQWMPHWQHSLPQKLMICMLAKYLLRKQDIFAYVWTIATTTTMRDQSKAEVQVTSLNVSMGGQVTPVSFPILKVIKGHIGIQLSWHGRIPPPEEELLPCSPSPGPTLWVWGTVHGEPVDEDQEASLRMPG